MSEGQDGYDFSDPFDAKRWAMHHDRVCAMRWTSTDMKLGFIIKAGSTTAMFALTIVLGMLGWSLKANYDAQVTSIAAIHQAAADSSSETVRRLGATPPPPTR